MNLVLVKAEERYKEQITEMMNEWTASGEKIVPYAIRKADYHDFDSYISSLELKDVYDGKVPNSTFFCLDTDRNLVVGAVNIRHYLNEDLLRNGGHIGDGVRPAERRKGVATKMISLALDECRKLGIRKVLMVCDKDNIGSAKSIINNGGVLENEIMCDGVIEMGVSEKDIIIENKAMSTPENIMFSKKIMEHKDMLKKGMNVGIVTTAYHMRRSIKIAERIFETDNVNIIPLPGKDNSSRRDTWYKGEKGRNIVIGELKKIIYYVSQGIIDDFEV